jgi:hypothetical protein
MTPTCFGSHNDDSRTTGGKVYHIVSHVFVGLLFAVAFAIVFALLVKLIWNSLMPTIFDLKQITFWQAFGIIILAKLLFGSFGSHRHDRWKKDRHYTPPWHRPSDRSDADAPPTRYHRDWKTYTQYWQEEGKAAFEEYMARHEKERKEDSRPT